MVHQLNLKFNEELKPRKDTEYIILHHSGVESRHSAEDVHRWHQKKGWAGNGYHYFIDKTGKIYRCRPRNTVGAHAKGYNENSIGVCFEGDFNKETMTDAQLSFEVIEFLYYLQVAYPESRIVFCDELEKHQVPTIKGFQKEKFWQLFYIMGEDPGGFDRIPEDDWDEWVESFI